MKIETKSLSFAYGKEAPVFSGLSLSLSSKQSIAMIGQNGAGKTTFVKLLKGLLVPKSGDILFDGVSTAGKTAAQLAARIGLVFQNPGDQIFKNNVLDEVMFGPLHIGQSEAQAKEHAQDALERVGLLGKQDENPFDLGLPEQKMLAIASVLAMQTDAVIFDEPTIAQDAAGRARIQAIIQELVREGKLVIAILHDMDFVADTLDRSVVFAGGRILADGPTAQVFADKESLQQAALEEPASMRLGRLLGYQEVFLTVKELAAHIQMGLSSNNDP